MRDQSFHSSLKPPLPRTIHSSKLGERMKFIKTAADTNGEKLEFDHVMQKNSGYSEEHIHTTQTEVYRIKQGTAVYVINGVEKTAKAGETVIIEENTYHVNPWNRDSEEDLIIERETFPEGGAQLFFVTWFTLVNANLHTTPGFNMNMLQISLVGATIPARTYVKNMPIFIQKIGVPLLAFIARVIGYKARYPELETNLKED